jgi:hypothetical protein
MPNRGVRDVGRLIRLVYSRLVLLLLRESAKHPNFAYADAARFVTSIKNDHTNTLNQLQMAQQRVADLEAQLAQSSSFLTQSNNLPEQTGVSSTFPHPPAEVENYYTGFAQTILGIDRSSLIPAQSTAQEDLPSIDIAQKAARMFFETYDRHYLFLNKGEFMVDLQDIWGEQGSAISSEDGRRKEFIVMMITSVGAHLCEAKGDIDVGTSKILREKAMRNLGAAISKTDLVSTYRHVKRAQLKPLDHRSSLLGPILLGPAWSTSRSESRSPSRYNDAVRHQPRLAPQMPVRSCRKRA